MKKLTAVDLGMLYHDWVARLYTSDHAGIVPGRAREEISWDTYSKEWHREYGPARWVNAGAREVRGRLILETARGRVIDLPADEAAVGLLALQSGAPDDLIDALVGLDATGAWGSELGRELRRALKEQGYTVKRSKKSVYGRKNPYDDDDEGYIWVIADDLE